MRYFLFGIVFFLTACGHTGLKHEEFINSVRKGNFQRAEQLADEKDFYQDKPSALLREMELGSLHFLKADFYQALQHFDKAKKISDDLYTTSISKKITSNVLGDGLDAYTGPRFEQSLIRYYQSLTNYMLSQVGFYEAYKEEDKSIPQQNLDEAQKRKHFQASRAIIKEWDAFIKSLQYESTNEDEFNYDMLAKTWGAKVHTLFDTNTDDQIARILYDDAKKISKKSYAKYPSFSKTDKFLNYVNKEQENIKAEKPNNVHFVLNAGTIIPKTAGEYSLTLPFVHLRKNTGCARIFQGQRFGYEFPEMKEPRSPQPFTYTIAKEGKEVRKGDFVLTEPLSEIAYAEFKRVKPSLVAKKTARLISKYSAAVVSACATYNSNNNNNDPWKELAIWGAFKLATVGIEESEYADVRYWGLLPNAIYQQSVRLGKGSYVLKVYQNGTLVQTLSFEVESGKNRVIVLNVLG